MLQTKTQSAAKTIFISWVVAGSLDMLTALLVYSVLLKKVSADRLVRGIASGFFKDEAFSGGSIMILYGVLFHYFIAFCFAAFFYIIYPHVLFFKKHPVISGLLYGLFAWLVMNLIVLRIAFGHFSAFTLQSVAIGAGILMLMIGLPISLITNANYPANKLRS